MASKGDSVGVFFYHWNEIDPMRSHFWTISANIKTFPTVYQPVHLFVSANFLAKKENPCLLHSLKRLFENRNS